MQETNKTETFNFKTLIPVGAGIAACLIFLIIMSVVTLKKSNELVEIGTANLSVAQTYLSVAKANATIAKANSTVPAKANAPVDQTIACVCPNCGISVVPKCFYCGRVMQWDQARGAFRCTPCQRVGIPNCPTCKVPMQARISSLPVTQSPGLAQGGGAGNPAQLT